MASYILVNFGLGNGLSSIRRQAITWTNVDLLSIRPQETHFNEILFNIDKISFKKMYLKMPSAQISVILLRLRCVKYLACFHTHENLPRDIRAPGSQPEIPHSCPRRRNTCKHDGIVKFYALLALCVENPPVTDGFPSQRVSWTELFGEQMVTILSV